MVEHAKILLKNCGSGEVLTLAGAQARGAYNSIKKALKLSPKDIIEEIKKSELRGRGGAAFPTGIKWVYSQRTGDTPVYLIANGDESEIGTFKDRYLMEHDPHLIIEGIMISAYALNANWACIYIRGEYAKGYEILSKALKECYNAGFLGKNIFNSNFNLDIVIHRGAGAYICGEESALLNSLEGGRGCPRLKPPYPVESGLYGCPTVINNIETLANVPWIIENGANAYRQIGTSNSYGTKLISVSGCVNKTGVFEINLGYPLSDFIKNECGGVKDNRELKGVFVGGTSVNILRVSEIDNIKIDYDSLKSVGSSLGSAGMIVLDDSCKMLDVAMNVANFYTHESCGQCPQCREGTLWLKKVLQRLVNVGGSKEDVDLVISICDEIEKHTICSFGDAMVLPIRSIFSKFREEIIEEISNKNA